MSYGAHRAQDSSGARPHLSHPGERQGIEEMSRYQSNEFGYYTNLSSPCLWPDFYNSSRTSAFLNKTEFSCISILTNRGLLSQDLSFQESGDGGH